MARQPTTPHLKDPGCRVCINIFAEPVDWRLLLVAFPVLAALSWVVFIIGRDALNQFQRTMKEFR